MSEPPLNPRALQRKKRQAAALKANLKRRKDKPPEDDAPDTAQDSHEEQDG